MGNTFPLSGGGVDAVEGVFGDGRALAVRRSAAGRRSDERGLSRVRHFAQDRLQDLRALQGTRSGGPDRSFASAGSLRQPLPQQIETLIVAAKREKPHWGARKIRERLVRRLDGDIRVPANSTNPCRAPPARPGQSP